MTVYLADSNVLIALSTDDHVHHKVALGWFRREEPDVATCPITQGALLRFLIRGGHTATEALLHLDLLISNPWHEFWPDDLPYSAPMLDRVIGHRQVTDAYLVSLADHHDGRLVTLDRGLVAMHPQVLFLEP